MDKNFPNGFDSWARTHFELAWHMGQLIDLILNPKLHDMLEDDGPEYMADMIKEWTNEFESTYPLDERIEEGDFIDKIDNFIAKKLDEL